MDWQPWHDDVKFFLFLAAMMGIMGLSALLFANIAPGVVIWIAVFIYMFWKSAE